MSKYVKILLQAIALLSITLGVFSAQAMAKTNIQYEVINGDTLVISGNGETEEAIKYGKEVKKSQIKKLIIKEGITKITPLGIGKFESVREVVLPDTLTEIGDTTFAGCYKLKKGSAWERVASDWVQCICKLHKFGRDRYSRLCS